MYVAENPTFSVEKTVLLIHTLHYAQEYSFKINPARHLAAALFYPLGHFLKTLLLGITYLLKYSLFIIA